MIVLSPKVKLIITPVFVTRFFHQLQHPLFSIFIWIVVDSFFQLDGCPSSHIPHDIFRVILLRSHNPMDMACRYYPRIKIHSFIFNTIPSTIQHNIAAFVADKKIDLVYYIKCYEVDTLWIVEFILGAHFLHPK